MSLMTWTIKTGRHVREDIKIESREYWVDMYVSNGDSYITTTMCIGLKADQARDLGNMLLHAANYCEQISEKKSK